MTFEPTPLTPRIGTEIRTDLDTLLSGRHARDIRELLEGRGVLVFRDIAIDDAQQLAFGQTLGQTREEFGVKVTPITVDAGKSPRFAEYARGTEYWHIDGTYTQLPPLASILRPITLSPGVRENSERQVATEIPAYPGMTVEEEDKE